MNRIERIRRELDPRLPWAIQELLLSNVVVGNYNPYTVIRLSRAMAERLAKNHPAEMHIPDYQI